ncbi:MAG: hypothetical protein ACRDK4_05020 [Solirubrobacteraceae bacterium]
MAAAKKAGARTGAGQRQRALPPITVAKLEETGKLIEQLVSENQSLFISKGQAYKEAHREGSRRPLDPVESAQIAAAIARDGQNPVEVASEVQASDLRAYDEPEGREILLAAGVGVAPAFVEAVRRVVALVEMPSEQFEAACESDTLEQEIETCATALRSLELPDARQRASAAFAHYARSAGFEPGEAWSLPVQAVWQALTGAMSHLVDASASSSLIDSAANTGGDDDTSSMTSDGPKP